MKLVNIGPRGQERPGLVDASGDARLLPAGEAHAGPGVSFDAIEKLAAIKVDDLEPAEEGARIGSCLGWVRNFHCIGLNYARHAAETGAKNPEEPILFNKATTALSGPFDDVVLPPESKKTDWEVEIAAVIGRDTYRVSEAQALHHVVGYCVVNDVSEREYQIERGGQWTKGKSLPTYGPTGPWLVTSDEVPDPQALDIWLDLNGEKAQASSTSDMIFSIAEIVAYMSRFMKLEAGDIITTGTPEGVGMGRDPKRFLKPGDELRLGVEGLGEQRQRVVALES